MEKGSAELRRFVWDCDFTHPCRICGILFFILQTLEVDLNCVKSRMRYNDRKIWRNLHSDCLAKFCQWDL